MRMYFEQEKPDEKNYQEFLQKEGIKVKPETKFEIVEEIFYDVETRREIEKNGIRIIKNLQAEIEEIKDEKTKKELKELLKTAEESFQKKEFFIFQGIIREINYIVKIKKNTQQE